MNIGHIYRIHQIYDGNHGIKIYQVFTEFMRTMVIV